MQNRLIGILSAVMILFGGCSDIDTIRPMDPPYGAPPLLLPPPDPAVDPLPLRLQTVGVNGIQYVAGEEPTLIADDEIVLYLTATKDSETPAFDGSLSRVFPKGIRVSSFGSGSFVIQYPAAGAIRVPNQGTLEIGFEYSLHLLILHLEAGSQVISILDSLSPPERYVPQSISAGCFIGAQATSFNIGTRLDGNANVLNGTAINYRWLEADLENWAGPLLVRDGHFHILFGANLSTTPPAGHHIEISIPDSTECESRTLTVVEFSERSPWLSRTKKLLNVFFDIGDLIEALWAGH